ncbi:YbaB/EbfC family nucleoid-associated protein [Mycoplasma sp. CSL10137]|uniref:YbaB/EbfC family nucleoid-associated protein n=2 Tax=Mycoplasma TaxID=2093 RepID=UPI00197B9EE3|nr:MULTISPECIES: YbaB/EbfC family nucleoid-associated protein [unclassified Mycoplasma]MBN4083707.1 YbaB/EbfC family nucleoid-associated protein [Mycoplasma sp. CSL10137]MBN4084660.1 YbaB/EbfC family nucleoid-associated protein [Mycoplasma sp. CSL10166]MBU4693139.1 YbaB/EbfC family nucleoid-associated protein [Mycoplasma sp. CSL7491-lung]
MNPEMIKRLKKIQKDFEDTQKKFKEKEFTLEKQGIELVATGDYELKKININEALIDPDDKELLEDLLLVAINELFENIQTEEEKNAPSLPGGLPF